jgi:hypothetical protein
MNKQNNENKLAPNSGRWQFDEQYKLALKASMIYQIMLLVASRFIVQGDQYTLLVLIAIAAYWVSAFLLIIRKRWQPTPFAVLYLKLGIFPIAAITPYIIFYAPTSNG